MRIIYFLAMGSFFFMSCYAPRYVYSPSAHNVPVLVKKGDSKLAAMYSTNLSEKTTDNAGTHESKGKGVDLQGAVAVTDNFAIQANYFNRRESNDGNSADNRVSKSYLHYKRNLTEIGVGYFKSLSSRNHVLFQVFGGVGKGRFSFTDDGKNDSSLSYSKSHQADITKVYIQPAIIFRTNGSFAGSISTRFSILGYSQIKTDYSYNELVSYNLDSLSSGARLFWEPAITNSFGFKKLPGIRIEYQVGTAILLSRQTIDYRSFNFSLALVFDIPKLLRRTSRD